MPIHQSRQSDGYQSVFIKTSMNCKHNLSATSIKIRLNNDAPLQYLARCSYKRSAWDEEETMLLGVGCPKSWTVQELSTRLPVNQSRPWTFPSTVKRWH
eukprot:scaffold1978_cov142-Skeletonema_marinoi.AAC.9